MKQSTTKSAALGRPSGRDSDKVRRDLLAAARDHFLKRDFKAVSLRQIASSAGVNGAMVNYYFGGKQGLYLAMVDEVFESLESKMAGLSGNAEFSIAGFSHSYCLFWRETLGGQISWREKFYSAREQSRKKSCRDLAR